MGDSSNINPAITHMAKLQYEKDRNRTLELDNRVQILQRKLRTGMKAIYYYPTGISDSNLGNSVKLIDRIIPDYKYSITMERSHYRYIDQQTNLIYHNDLGPICYRVYPVDRTTRLIYFKPGFSNPLAEGFTRSLQVTNLIVSKKRLIPMNIFPNRFLDDLFYAKTYGEGKLIHKIITDFILDL